MITPRDVDLSKYKFSGAESPAVEDLCTLDEKDQEQLLMAGVDPKEKQRSGSFLHMDYSKVRCTSLHEGLEVLDIKQALKKYDGLQDYFWKLISPDKDKYTKSAAENLHGGYFIRARRGAKIINPVQSCLFLKGEKVGQNVHNIVIVEEGAEMQIITGCSVAHGTREAAHLGISEFYIEKNAKLTFTMIHNWSESAEVRPRSAGIVHEGGVFQNNYILLKTVKDLQMNPAVTLAGRGAIARFNSVIVAPPGSYVNAGSQLFLNAPETRGEIIAHTLTSGGTIINPGYMAGNAVPCRGHLECKGLILEKGVIHAVPELIGTLPGVELSHEAAVGKIAQEEIDYLTSRGLDEEEATSTIVRGFLNIDIMGLPPQLQEVVDKTMSEVEKDMF